MPVVYEICKQIPDYMCDACGEPELGRVRGAAYIHKSIKEELTKDNLTDIDWWELQLRSKLIIIVPSTRGTFDGGAKNTITGFGNDTEKIIGKTFVTVVNDANHTRNLPFYEALENNYKNYIFAFRTGSELRVATDVITGLEVKDAVEEDANSAVVWQATITWVQKTPKTMVPIYEISDEIKDLFINCIEQIIV